MHRPLTSVPWSDVATSAGVDSCTALLTTGMRTMPAALHAEVINSTNRQIRWLAAMGRTSIVLAAFRFMGSVLRAHRHLVRMVINA